MAIETVDPFVDVGAVIEIRVVRYLVDALPRQGSAILIIFGQLDDLRTVLARNGVAVHADGDSGNAGMRRNGDGSMAILAVNPHGSRVKAVRKGDGLGGSVADTVPLGPGEIVGGRKRSDANENHDRHTNAQGIVKQCFVHRLVRSSRSR